MPLRPDMEPGDYLDILRRRKWVILFSFLIILFGATVYCVLAPDLFQSTVKILIIPPAVGEGMVRSTVNINTRDRLGIIQQDVFSSTRLKAVINEMGIFREELKDMSEDALVGVMQKRIIMNLDRNVITLSFDHEDPKVAKNVASRLASFIIDENIKVRGVAIQGTAKFLESQLEETRKKLEEQEDKIKRYKLQFGGELPQQMQANLSQLSRLQDQIKNNSDYISRLEDRKVFLEAQISNMMSNFRTDANPPDSPGDPAASTGQLLGELAMRRKKMEELNSKYTPLHPAVVQARREVEQLEAKIAKLRQADKKAEGTSPSEGAGPSSSKSVTDFQQVGMQSGEVQRLREQVANVNMEITALKRESKNAAQMIDSIQLKVERLPQREQEMISLSRDYENIKKSYDELLRKKLEANISENLEEKQKGEQFQILEPANLPIMSYKPKRLKILGLALIVSLLIGAGGAIGLEMLDPTLRGTRDFKNFFDLPVLACLPVIQDDRYKHRVAVQRAVVIGGLVSIMGAYLAFLLIHGEKVKSILQSLGSVN